MNHSNELSWTTSTQNDGQSSLKETVTLLDKSKNCSSQADTKTIIIDRPKFISLMIEGNLGQTGSLMSRVHSRFEEFFNCKLKFNSRNPFAVEQWFELTFNDEKDLMMFILRYM